MMMADETQSMHSEDADACFLQMAGGYDTGSEAESAPVKREPEPAQEGPLTAEKLS